MAARSALGVLAMARRITKAIRRFRISVSLLLENTLYSRRACENSRVSMVKLERSAMGQGRPLRRQVRFSDRAWRLNKLRRPSGIFPLIGLGRFHSRFLWQSFQPVCR